jgi:hypothetical protein
MSSLLINNAAAAFDKRGASRSHSSWSDSAREAEKIDSGSASVFPREGRFVTNLSPSGQDANPRRGDKTEERERASATDKEWTRLSKGSPGVACHREATPQKGEAGALLLFLWRIFARRSGTTDQPELVAREHDGQSAVPDGEARGT